jgi:hypothetical protein
MRFAGTAHKIAFVTLRKFVDYFEKLYKQKLDKVDKVIISNSLDTIAIALSLVMSGTSHYQSLIDFHLLHNNLMNIERTIAK